MARTLKYLSSKQAAFVGFVFTLPFLILNKIANDQIEPFYALIQTNGFFVNPFAYFLLAISLLLLPIGAIISIQPLFQKTNERHKTYFINIILSITLILFFIVISLAFGSEIYQCEVLRVPNCD